jgi:hypothetical protein
MALIISTLSGCTSLESGASSSEFSSAVAEDHSLTPGPENCKNAPSNWTCADDDETLIYPEVVAAINKELEIVPFPPGTTFEYPVDRGWYTMPDGTLGRDHFFPIEGTLQVEGQGFCAWVGVWLDQHETGSSLETQAWDFIVGFPKRLTFTQAYDAGTQTLVQDYIDKASVGDPSGLNDWYSHC